MTKKLNEKMRQSADQVVEITNDFSIESKFSTVIQRYINDEFIRYFIIKKHVKRSPLINLGYYIRFKAIEYAFSLIVPDVVITVGAGFDTSSFRHKNIRFIEIDLPAVAHNKGNIIRLNNLHSNEDIDPSALAEKYPAIVFKSLNYTLIGGDLTEKNTYPLIIESLKGCLRANDKIAILNECCLCYIEEQNSNSILLELTNLLKKELNIENKNIYYIGYEQVKPILNNDAFSVFMLEHFISMGSPLKTFLSEADQVKRFTNKLNFNSAKVINMCKFFEHHIDQKELERVDSLELFDEFEEFHLLCSCYALTIARMGENLPLNNESDNSLSQDNFNINSEVPFRTDYISTIAPQSVYRYGQASTVMPDGRVLIFGGFGCTSNLQRHQRHYDFITFDASNKMFTECSFDGVKQPGRIFSDIIHLHENRYLISGGRESPSKPCSNIIVQEVAPNQFTTFESSLLDSQIDGWRHVLLAIPEQVSYCKLGGQEGQSENFIDIFDLTTLKKTRSLLPELSYHSHASTVFAKHTILTHGGLCPYSSGKKFSKSCFLFDLRTNDINYINPQINLYSHKIHAIDDNKIAFVGGLNESGSFNFLSIFDLRNHQLVQTNEVIEIKSTDSNGFPVMLHNFVSEYVNSSQLYIFGGGGNCFSFGTHYNKSYLSVSFA